MYKLQKDNLTEKITSIGILENPFTVIPIDPANTDYQKYLEWVAAGNTPEPADE